METNRERSQRKVATGKVLSDKMEKTIAVQVERLEKHPKYKKYVRRYTKLYAHDEKGDAKVGDVVRVMATRPLSKLKRWRLVEVVVRAKTPMLATVVPEQVIADLAPASKPPSGGGEKKP